ncbi:MAG: hypothetical protein JWN04_5240, partial [Myxococcaceae bacterium]|nr:hypothetical protein [Myxococcaceae bacterium]
MGRLASLYFPLVLSALYVFFLQPAHSFLVRFAAAAVHWPAELLRSLTVGRWLEMPLVVACDYLNRVLGHQSWLGGVIVALSTLVCVAVVVHAEEKKEALAVRMAALGVLLVLVLGTSVMLSSMHLARFARTLPSTRSTDVERALFWDLMAASVVGRGLDDPAALVARVQRVSSQLDLVLPEDATQGDVVAANRALDEQLRKLRELADGAPAALNSPAFSATDKREERELRSTLHTFTQVFDFALRLQSAVLSGLSEHGRGGGLDQRWRELSFRGPGGNQIVISTNTLAPALETRPVLPNAVKESRQSVAQHFRNAATQGPETPEMTALLEQFEHEPFSALEPDDVLFRTWYQVTSAYFAEREMLRLLYKLNIDERDAYGLLKIRLYDSKAAYVKDAPLLAERGAAGAFDRSLNTIFVYEEERESSRIEARGLLAALPAALGAFDQRPASRAMPASDPSSLTPQLARFLHAHGAQDDTGMRQLLAMNPPKPAIEPYAHELTHWIVSLALDALPLDGSAASQCLQEGAALSVDRLMLRYEGRAFGAGSAQEGGLFAEGD